MNIEILPLDAKDVYQYKTDMQEAFQLGAVEGGFLADGEIILPESHIDRAFSHKNAIAYKAVADGEMVGGAIIVVDIANFYGHLDFLYVKHGKQGNGIGKFMWFEIEKMHPEIKIWETCTPYFEKRNIHFYINVCGFHAVEFFNLYHKDPNNPEEYEDKQDDGMFSFKKVIK